MIQADAHSDDHVVEVQFDATPWFEQASEVQIADLIACGYGGDYPADAVAQYMADHHQGVKRLFDYLEVIEHVGFECHVSQGDAEDWYNARDALFALRCLTKLGETSDGGIVIGPQGWGIAQDTLSRIEAG